MTKKSWSLSCFGILGKRGKSFQGGVDATVKTTSSIKKHIKRLTKKKKKKNVVTRIPKDDDGKV